MDNLKALKEDIGRLIGSLDDEAFSWIALTFAGIRRPQIYPDGLGGFRDRKKIQQLINDCKKYADLME